MGRVDRPSTLSMSGPMGMSGPVTAVWSMELSPSGSGTTLALSHRAFGDIDEETRAAYTSGWTDVVEALRGTLAGA